MSKANSDVLIVGAGLAGLAAATALSSQGAHVTLLERKPYVGGRAYSYPHPALHEEIDSQHVLLGCCTNLLDLCRQAGADHHIRWYDGIPFLEPATSPGGRPRRSVLGPGPLPAPAHSALSFLRASMLTLADKTRIALGMAEFLRGYPADDAEPFSAWLLRTRQTERAIRHFWEPLILATVNDSFERCSTRYAGMVIHEVFLASPLGGRMGIPTQPLSIFYDAVARLATAQGTDLRLRSSVDTIARTAAGWTVATSTGEALSAPNLLLALPFEQTARLLQTLPAGDPARDTLLPLTTHFSHAPITTIHLWFDRTVADGIHNAALLDTRIQWIFNKTAIRRLAGPGEYLELVISGSFPELTLSREDILAGAVRELALFFPTVRDARLLKSGLLKEARATFSVVPGLDVFRPPAAAGDGLFLAGDWTRSGWPATMEGATRSGRLAAAAITGQPALTPDLKPTGLMRWLQA